MQQKSKPSKLISLPLHFFCLMQPILYILGDNFSPNSYALKVENLDKNLLNICHYKGEDRKDVQGNQQMATYRSMETMTNHCDQLF